MSGGIDSAVSAHLLKEQGYDVTGVNMRLWQYDETCEIPEGKSVSCCSPEDMSDAEKTARAVGIPFYAVKLENEFRDSVVNPFISEYASARTPNPCALCNSRIKFDLFFKKIFALGFDFIATGHYASIIKTPDNRLAIAAAKDAAKDQSYYLFGLEQQALSKTLFPLADKTKPEVRQIASRARLPVAQKSESQEICFIPDHDYRGFLKKNGVQFTPGRFLRKNGEVLGEHDGREKFTIGQRKGLGIATGEPLYVINIDTGGDITLGTKEELMNTTTFLIKKPVYQGWAMAPAEPATVRVQVRYNSRPVKATASDDGAGNLKVQLVESVNAITPGQAGVVYHESEGYILAGGFISLI